jgi:hypothetical protein
VAERAAGVGADAVDSVQSAIYIADSHRITVNINLNCRARKQEFYRADASERHAFLFVPWALRFFAQF